MAKDKIRRREVPAPPDKIPLVSVVIPMYNSAKFIPQTLESLLYQTLNNFEVVVVDDCSTDNSVEVVESFAKRFGGRLRVVKLRENTGTPGIPRNVGINIARGKYIAFLDSDDLYTKSALEEQVALAEKFQADVVHMNDTFRLFDGKAMDIDDPRMTDFAVLTNPANHTLTNWCWPIMARPEPVAEPTPMPDSLEERVRIWLDWKYRWVPYSTFCRREFLIANQIYFADITTSEDVPFCFECMCLAKTCVQVPNVVYIIRPRTNSASREDMSADFAKNFGKRVAALNDVFNEFERIMDKIPFFKAHPNFRYAVLNWYTNQRLPFAFQNIYAQISAYKLSDLVKREFHPDDAALTAYLFNKVNVYRLKMMRLQQELIDSNRRGHTLNDTADGGEVSANNLPLVSVIIPMYNSAKFIEQTLESLLYQTLENFEVVVVDDCSTDNSVEVVGSYIKRFGGRLRLVKLRENTGAPGIPRNVGINIARGKYIAFLDSDDLFTKTALEELTTLAENFQADVLNQNSRYHLYDEETLPIDDPRMTDFNELTNPKNFKIITGKHAPIVEAQFESTNFAVRVRNWLNWKYRWGIPSLFCKREFLIANQIYFPKSTMFEDMSFFFECLCKAAKFLRVPNITYIVRPRDGSATRGENTIKVKKTLKDYFRVANDGSNEFDRIMNQLPFFQIRPDYRYAVLNFFFRRSYEWPWSFSKIYAQVPAYKLNDLVKREFHPDDAALVAYLFNTFNVYRLKVSRLQQEIYNLKQEGTHGQK